MLLKISIELSTDKANAVVVFFTGNTPFNCEHDEHFSTS
jgi:hypothetical protein